MQQETTSLVNPLNEVSTNTSKANTNDSAAEKSSKKDSRRKAVFERERKPHTVIEETDFFATIGGNGGSDGEDDDDDHDGSHVAIRDRQFEFSGSIL